MNDRADTARGEREAQADRALAGKYMVFRLGDEEYGLGVLQVRELIGRMEVTRVAGARDFIRGVINLRGKVIPVVDLRLKLAMTRTMDTEQTVMIVVQHASRGGDLATAVLVDEVLEVLDVDCGRIEAPPSFGSHAPAVLFILGFAKVGDRIIFLLDVDRILGTPEHGAPGAVAS